MNVNNSNWLDHTKKPIAMFRLVGTHLKIHTHITETQQFSIWLGKSIPILTKHTRGANSTRCTGLAPKIHSFITKHTRGAETTLHKNTLLHWQCTNGSIIGFGCDYMNINSSLQHFTRHAGLIRNVP